MKCQRPSSVLNFFWSDKTSAVLCITEMINSSVRHPFLVPNQFKLVFSITVLLNLGHKYITLWYYSVICRRKYDGERTCFESIIRLDYAREIPVAGQNRDGDGGASSIKNVYLRLQHI